MDGRRVGNIFKDSENEETLQFSRIRKRKKEKGGYQQEKKNSSRQNWRQAGNLVYSSQSGCHSLE